MEFPPTCEVRVNNTQITANLKGLKKKPGTAPPPDISKYSRITSTNRVEMVYVNSQQPVQSKVGKPSSCCISRIYWSTSEILYDRDVGRSDHDRRFGYQSQRPTPLDSTGCATEKYVLDAKDKACFTMLYPVIQAMSEDDDIIAGPQKMSLKCPVRTHLEFDTKRLMLCQLTFVRITTPCRSSKCVHPQCFDATSWFTMMEQTTTWLCPVCERMLDHRDLIMDG